jgi:hypothetical protein
MSKAANRMTHCRSCALTNQRAFAVEVIPNVKSLWRPKSTEELKQALDNTQNAILEALECNDSNAIKRDRIDVEDAAVKRTGLELAVRQSMLQERGKRAYGHRLGKDQSARRSCHSIASEKWRSPR